MWVLLVFHCTIAVSHVSVVVKIVRFSTSNCINRHSNTSPFYWAASSVPGLMGGWVPIISCWFTIVCIHQWTSGGLLLASRCVSQVLGSYVNTNLLEPRDAVIVVCTAAIIAIGCFIGRCVSAIAYSNHLSYQIRIKTMSGSIFGTSGWKVHGDWKSHSTDNNEIMLLRMIRNSK